MAKRNRVLGLINLTESDFQMKSLTDHRPVAAIPFGGRYRIIDFVLSNMSLAGVDTIGIYLQGKERSLMDHIRSGHPWDMDRMSGGIFYFSPYSSPDRTYDIRGDIMNYYNNIDLLEKSNCEYVIMSSTAMVMNIDFNKVIDAHIDSKVDVTVVYKNYDSTDHYYDNAYILNTEEDDRINSFGVKIVKRTSKNVTSLTKVSTETYIMKVSLLKELIEDAVSSGSSTYMREVLHDAARLYHFKGYEFKGYIAYISSIQNYYISNMDLLNEEHLMDLFYGSSLINTKIRNENPSFYSGDSNVTNSLIANGCVIEGEVVNSILFRRVHVEKGARIENSIIMQNGTVKKGANLKNCIADKNVIVSEGQMMSGTKKNPLVLVKNSVI